MGVGLLDDVADDGRTDKARTARVFLIASSCLDYKT